MRGAGKLDRRIEFERFTATLNDFGEEVQSWSSYTIVWASRSDVLDSEKYSAGQVNATQMSRFVVRSSIKSRSINPTDRINYDGDFWDIHGVKETKEGRKRFLEFTAMRQSD